MARFRKAELRLWADERFRSLTPPPPNARDLWIALLIGDCTTQIPGVVIATPGKLADSLGWGDESNREAFDRAFAEVLLKMPVQVDREAGLIWLPNGPRYNKPVNPNVILGWHEQWHLVPECPLKLVIFRGLEKYAKLWGGVWLRNLTSALTEGCSPECRDQEQEQEQEVTTLVGPQAARQLTLQGPTSQKNGSAVTRVFDHWRSTMGHPCAMLDNKRERVIRHALKLREGNVEDLLAAIDGCKATPWNMGANDRHTIYDGLALIFKDADHLERFMATGRPAPRRRAPALLPAAPPTEAPWPTAPPPPGFRKFGRAPLTDAPPPPRRTIVEEPALVVLSPEEEAELEARKQALQAQALSRTKDPPGGDHS